MEAAAASTKSMLLLAQQKLDDINRENLGLSNAGLGRGCHRRKGVIASHLLSTLLYISILSYKLEDVKTMLEEEDAETYEEWRCLFETIHSPHFHAQERMIQNQRVKRTFSRKRRYKAEAQRLREELTNASSELSKLQILSNETSNLMSKAINELHEERASLVSAGDDKQRRFEELNEQYSDLRIEVVQKDAMLQSLESELDDAKQMLNDRNKSFAALEEELSQHKLDAAVAKDAASYSQSTLDDVRAQLNACNSRLSDYQLAAESMRSKLHHELMEAQSSNAVLSAKLVAANELLDATKQQFEEVKGVIVEKSATHDDIKNRLDALEEVVQSGVSQMTTYASDKAVSLELRVEQVLSACTNEIHKGLVDVREAVGGCFDRQNNCVLKELLNIRHQMKDIGQLHQLDTLRQQLANVQQSLDCISQHRLCETTISIDDNQAGDLVENIISRAVSRLGGVDPQ
jgi:chromosome segregation ATPase